jgi:chromosomal replication initiation ATPase DnaA
LQFEEISAGVLVMKAPSKFHADHINAKFYDRLSDIAVHLPENVQKVKVRA